MGLAGGTWRADVPDEPNAWVEFRRLSQGELADVRKQEVILTVKFREETADEESRPTDGFIGPLLKAAIVGWSYDAPVDDPIRQLDMATAGWCLDEINRGLSARTDDEQKNGSSASTPGSAAKTA